MLHNGPSHLVNYSEKILRQLPGMILCMDTNHIFTFANAQAVSNLGFENETQMLGLTSSNIRCRAVECADQFIQQNILVMREETPLKILDIQLYANNKPLFLLTNKVPFYDSNHHVNATLIHCNEITHRMLLNITMAIAHSDRKYRNKKNLYQRSYTVIENGSKKNKLSARELECLFYLVRGKSRKETGSILNLSSRTVGHYLDNIKIKLDCNNKSDLIEMAVEGNLINYIPESIFSRFYNNISEII